MASQTRKLFLMLLLLMRHGIAERADAFIYDSRLLTQKGIERTHQAARGLKLLVPHPDTFISSPKIRAIQTAAQVREVYGHRAPVTQLWPELTNNNFEIWRRNLRELKGQTVLLVGHEPHLSEFTSRLLAQKSFEFDWKKAGVCALGIDERCETATLLWFLPPRILRKLAP